MIDGTSVSVLMAVHNGARHLRQAVDSCLPQGVKHSPPIELIAVDDGSTDETPRILHECASRYQNLVVLEKPHTGLTSSLNFGLRHCRGTYIARLDADDLVVRGRFVAQASFLDRNPDIALVGSNAILIDENDRRIGETRLGALTNEQCRSRLLAMDACVPHSSWMVRREAMLGLGGYDEFFQRAQDFDFLLRLLEVGQMCCVPEALIFLRKSRSSLTYDPGLTQFRYAVVALLTHYHRAGLPIAFSGDRAFLLEQVSRWLEREGLRDKMLAQRSLSFAMAALRAMDLHGLLRDVFHAMRLDPGAPFRRRQMARIRHNLAPALREYLEKQAGLKAA